MKALELWGGVECSHVLIRGTVRDQLVMTGHGRRLDDLDRIAALGIRTLRTPVLWGAMEQGGVRDFAAADRRMARLEALGVAPIVGLLHHGSGPGGLLHPGRAGFAERFADYAGAVAARYPAARDWTPINEPVTTARFAFLYGHWHPHTRSEPAFLRAVFASAVATVAAMRAIRRHRPDARLVQTEDVGRVHSTATLAYQAEYENERRFLFLDLLAGRVGPAHPFRERLERAGVAAAALDALADAPTPADIVGIDHYLTSDRWLDGRRNAFPGVRTGGNRRHRYVDVAATGVPALKGTIGFLPRIREVFARYGTAVALTEVHNGCTREEQLRWLMDAWHAASAAQAEGVPVAAVTAWALFGSTDWNSLMTANRDDYESGAFDARFDPPRPTAVAAAIRALATGGRFDHPVLAQPGWWRRLGQGVDSAAPAVFALAASASCRDAFAAVAARRGLPLCAGSEAPLGVVTIALTDVLTLRLERADGLPLVVEAGPKLPFEAAVDAFLDAAIDGRAGRIRLAGPALSEAAVLAAHPT